MLCNNSSSLVRSRKCRDLLLCEGPPNPRYPLRSERPTIPVEDRSSGCAPAKRAHPKFRLQGRRQFVPAVFRVVSLRHRNALDLYLTINHTETMVPSFPPNLPAQSHQYPYLILRPFEGTCKGY